MLVSDRQTKPWLWITTILLIGGGAAYAFTQARQMNGASGSSRAGIVFGILSLAMMTFAMLLALRKKWRTLRLGRTYFWMQGHVWLGLLSYPFAFYHSGFRWGLTFNFTWVIMALFTVVILSGIVGLVLQNVLPTMILKRVQRETVYEQHDHVLGILRREVDERVAELRRMLETAPVGGTQGGLLDMAKSDVGMVVAVERLDALQSNYVLPYLQENPPRRSPLNRAVTSEAVFKQLYDVLPREKSEPVADIEQIVAERRQMLLHKSLHRWLHLWLIVHVPISYALFVLVIVHVVTALRFV